MTPNSFHSALLSLSETISLILTITSDVLFSRSSFRWGDKSHKVPPAQHQEFPYLSGVLPLFVFLKSLNESV